MSSDKLDIYNLGSAGVDVDRSAIHLEDGELISAQNAVQGDDGTLTKRDGLTKYDSTAGAGSILGFVAAPLGPGPADGTSDETTYYIPNAAGTWFKTTNSFSTSATNSVLGAAKADTAAATLNNRLYYVSTAETVRVFDGVQDSLFFDPPSFATTVAGVWVSNGTLYSSIQDGTTTGYVIELDSFGRMTQIGAAIPASFLVSKLIYHSNNIYAACVTSAPGQLRVYTIRPATATTATAWTLDYTTSGFTSVSSGSLASFKSLLYLGVAPAVGDTAVVYSRSATGTYSASDTATGTASDVTSLIVYKGSLYAAFSHYSGTGTANVMRKTTNGSSWSTAATLGTEDGLGEFYVVGHKAFMVNSGQQSVAGYYTSNGTSWTVFSVSGSNTIEGFGAFKAAGTGPAFGATSAFILMQSGSSLQIVN